MSRNLLLTLRFLGTRYHGFQVQKNALSVCEVFQDAVERVFGSRLDVKGCSRTDTGVHALMYCLSLKTDKTIPCDGMVHALNAYLPRDIVVTSCCEVDEDFHARYNCVGKEYRYQLLNNRTGDPFLEGRAYRYGFPLDVQMLHREAQGFLGTHDFVSFQSKGADITDTVRTIHAFSVEREGDLVHFTVRGDGFLYNMVRIMVGTLVHIAAGRLASGCIPGIIAAKDRSRAGKTMPACGLYLNRVFYSQEELLCPRKENS